MTTAPVTRESDPEDDDAPDSIEAPSHLLVLEEKAILTHSRVRTQLS